jgi:hypothetical protein
MSIRHGLRRHDREQITGRVRISWTPPGGLTQYLIGNALDISESGIRVSVTESLPIGQYVYIELERHGLRGNASVRSCIRRSVKTEMGLEFSNGLRWKRPESPLTGPRPPA